MTRSPRHEPEVTSGHIQEVFFSAGRPVEQSMDHPLPQEHFPNVTGSQGLEVASQRCSEVWRSQPCLLESANSKNVDAEDPLYSATNLDLFLYNVWTGSCLYPIEYKEHKPRQLTEKNQNKVLQERWTTQKTERQGIILPPLCFFNKCTILSSTVSLATFVSSLWDSENTTVTERESLGLSMSFIRKQHNLSRKYHRPCSTGPGASSQHWLFFVAGQEHFRTLATIYFSSHKLQCFRLTHLFRSVAVYVAYTPPPQY